MGKVRVVALAVALMRQHRFDWDVAYLSVWYGTGQPGRPTASPAQVVAWMGQVRNVPMVSEEQAEEWLAAYAGQK